MEREGTSIYKILELRIKNDRLVRRTQTFNRIRILLAGDHRIQPLDYRFNAGLNSILGR